MYLILGILADKQVKKMIELICPKAKKVFAVTPHNDRATLAHDLRDEIIRVNSNCESFEDYREAYEKALECCTDNDLLLISGSLYMVGDMRKVIKNSKKFK
jgi:dihydrofolate synthase/folylpolyglutamate synthase